MFSIEQTPAQALLDVGTIYFEPAVMDYPRGRQILERFPDAERLEVPSHWQIEGLHGNEGLVEDWVRIKRTVLVLGVKKSLSARPNSRSADFIAPSHANGCTLACAYCFVPRRKGYANPITTFVNIEQITRYIQRHAARQGPKPGPSQTDPALWVYEIGENNDCSVDAAIADNVRDLVALFHDIPNAKATFATKYVNRDLLDYDPQRKTRIRFSLMPQPIARLVDVRAAKIDDRIAAISEFVAAGYEVHVNFAPVIIYENWLADYAALFSQLDDMLSAEAKAQLKAEVIFLTHNEQLHEVNMRWHPKAEEVLWQPELQEAKASENGMTNVRYRRGFKGQQVQILTDMLRAKLPYCEIRYAF